MINCATIRSLPCVTLEFLTNDGDIVTIDRLEYAFFKPRLNDISTFEIRLFREDYPVEKFRYVRVWMEWSEIGFKGYIFQGVVDSIKSNFESKESVITGMQLIQVLEDLVIPLSSADAAFEDADPADVISTYAQSAIDSCDSLDATISNVKIGTNDWTGNGSYQKLWGVIRPILEANNLSIIADIDDTFDFTFSVQRIGTEAPHILRECDENAYIPYIEENKRIPNRVFVKARDVDGNEVVHVVDQSAGFERCIDVILETDSLDTSDKALQTIGEQYLARARQEINLSLVTRWSCTTIPFKDIKIGDRVIVDPYDYNLFVRGLDFNLESTRGGLIVSSVIGVFDKYYGE